MAETVVVTYAGANSVSVAITGGTPGGTYSAIVDTGVGLDSGTADGSGAITLSVDVTSLAAGIHEGILVAQASTPIGNPKIGVATIHKGTAGLYSLGETWSVVGTDRVDVTFPSTNAVHYGMQIVVVGGSDWNDYTGTGSDLTMTTYNSGNAAGWPGNATVIGPGAYAQLFVETMPGFNYVETLAMSLVSPAPSVHIWSRF